MGTVFSKNNTLYQVFSYSNGKTSLLTARSGDHGAVETVFRYFRLVVENMSGSEGTIQFSKLQFITADGIDTFKYMPAGATITDYVSGQQNKGSRGSSGEEATSGLLETGNKCCLVGIGTNYSSPYQVSPPLIIYYDLKSKRLDLSIYKKWHWYTSNDTSSNQGRSMVKFRIDVSNTGTNWNNATDTVNWTTVDSADFIGNIPEAFKQNKTLAYTGTISGLERKKK